MDQSRLINHDKWKKEEFVLYGQDMPKKYAYYKRSFGSYCAHIFLVTVSDEQELRNCWESVDNQIAFYIQQDTEMLIEKSNFYVCYFTAVEVSGPLKRRIEIDEFCSKKYIFDHYDTEKPEEVYCDDVERKLFFIEKDEIEGSDTEDKLKIKAVEVENFRVVEGQKRISFACENHPEKAADLVVIYGPNGTGKTTVLDSVEYTMTGRVDRLEKSVDTQNDRNSYPEAVYHNRENKDSDAYTMFITDYGDQVSRTVSRYDPVKSDVKRNANLTNESKKILGKDQEEQKKWSKFLLTHEVLDVFLSGTGPEEKYRLWVSGNSQLADKDKAFTDAMKASKAANSKLNRKNDDLKNAEEELKKLEEQKDTLSGIRSLIEKYNQNSADQLDADPFLDGQQLKADAYDQFMTRIRGIQQKNIKNAKTLNEQEAVLTKMQEIGFETIAGRFTELKDLEKTCRAQEQRVKFAKQCEGIKKQKEKQREALETLLWQQSEYGQLLEKWDQVLQIHAQQEKLEDLAKDYRKDISRTEEKTEITRRDISVMQERNGELDRKNAARENAVKSLNRIVYITGERNDVRAALDESARNLKKAEIKKVQLRAELDRYSDVSLPEYLAEDTGEKILAVLEIIPKVMRKNLYQTCLDYMKTKEKTDALNKAADINKEIVLKLQKDAQEFLKIYRDSTRCPVCGCDYGSVDALASRFTMALLQNSGGDEKQKEELAAELKQLEEKYGEWKNKAAEVIASKTETLKEQYQNSEKEYDTIAEEKKVLEEKEKSFAAEIAAEEHMLLSYGLTEPFNREKLESFYRRLTVSLQECDRKLAEYSEKIAQNETLKTRLEDQLRENLRAQEALCMLPDYAFVESGRKFRFDWEKVHLRKEELDRKIGEDRKGLKETETELEKLKDYYFVQPEVENSVLENCRQKLSAMKQENKPFLDYKDYSAKDMEDLMRKTEGEIKTSHQRSEILTDILNENQLRDYFERYSGCVKEVENLKNEKEKLEEKYQDKRAVYESRRDELQESLKNLHNQQLANEIFNKINPNLSMKGFDYKISFTDTDVPKPKLEVWVVDNEKKRYKPEYYFSTAQLNTIVFSIYMARALEPDKDTPLRTILVDDPVGHFDDINILSFADFLRILITEFKCQIVLTTFDTKVYQILERKLDPEHYRARFIDLDEVMNEN